MKQKNFFAFYINIQIQHLLLFNIGILDRKLRILKFKYNTCYYSTAIFCNASFTSLFKYNLCYYSTHFCFKRICENPIQTQHLLLFNYLTSTALYPGFKFKYNTCYCSTHHTGLFLDYPKFKYNTCYCSTTQMETLYLSPVYSNTTPVTVQSVRRNRSK